MIEANDDEPEVPVTMSGRMKNDGFAMVELPLAVKPTAEGMKNALSMIGGIHELSRVTADAVSFVACTILTPSLLDPAQYCLNHYLCRIYSIPLAVELAYLRNLLLCSLILWIVPLMAS